MALDTKNDALPSAGPFRQGDPMQPSLYQIVRRIKDTADTFTIELEAEDHDVGVPFAPGQFNMLYMFGAGESAISISGNPARPMRLVHTIRAVGSVTRAVEKLRKGDQVGIRGPYGKPWPVEEVEGNDVVLLAGGIGMAPLRPVMYHLLANRQRYGRVVLLYGSRTPDDVLYRAELKKWASRNDVEIEVTVDQASGSWDGHVGVVTKRISRIRLDPFKVRALICGPEVMMHFCIMELKNQGVRDNQIYVSMERNMKCAIGFCGHCQYGPKFICKDGPVFNFSEIQNLFHVAGI